MTAPGSTAARWATELGATVHLAEPLKAPEVIELVQRLVAAEGTTSSDAEPVP